VLNNLGLIESDQGNVTVARAHFGESADAARSCADAMVEVIAELNEGRAALQEGDLEAAELLLTRNLANAGQVGQRIAVATTTSLLGSIAFYRGELARSESLGQEALALARELNLVDIVVQEMRFLARNLALRGDLSGARERFREVLPATRENAFSFSMAECLDELVTFAALAGDSANAATFAGASDGLRETIATRRFRLDQDRFERTVAQCRAQLGDTAFGSRTEAGRRLDAEGAVSCARAWLDALAIGDRAGAASPSEKRGPASRSAGTVPNW
jgi:ATP/maltotriose-dependent transcriptional regulator MalT